MTGAITLIKMNVVGSLRTLSSEFLKRVSEKDVSLTAQYHLYTRFKSVSTKLAPLLGELERRARSYPDELSALLAECHYAYFSMRKSLLVPRVVEEIRGLDPGRSDLVELTREGCGYLKQLCTEEWALYHEFFGSGEICYMSASTIFRSSSNAPRGQYLETLCDLLYDDITLPEQGHARTSQDLASNPPSSASQTHHNQVGNRLHIGHLVKMVLQDVQTRFFFKAQTVIQSKIRHYVPKAEDLVWPDILVCEFPPNIRICALTDCYRLS
jgi:hypothetical protein